MVENKIEIMPFLYNVAPIPGHLLKKEIWLPFLYNAAAIPGHLQKTKIRLALLECNCSGFFHVALYRNRSYSSSYSLLLLLRRADLFMVLIESKFTNIYQSPGEKSADPGFYQEVG